MTTNTSVLHTPLSVTIERATIEPMGVTWAPKTGPRSCQRCCRQAIAPLTEHEKVNHEGSRADEVSAGVEEEGAGGGVHSRVKAARTADMSMQFEEQRGVGEKDDQGDGGHQGSGA